MKIILSRKGFDSQFGGCPSPIFPADAGDKANLMLSLPIPEKDSDGNVYDMGLNSVKLDFKGFTFNERFVHLDPDIRPNIYKKHPEQSFMATLGQSGAAASHLKNEEVSPGDIFLFFGLFRLVKQVSFQNKMIRWQFVKDQKPFHAIWGYMQIDEIVDLEKDDNKKKFKNHLHVKVPHDFILNIIYTGKKKLELPGEQLNIPGYGAFKFDELLRLTLPDDKCLTHWKKDCLPWLENNRPNMTGHSEENCKEDYFQSRPRGQEFVVTNAEQYLDWLKKLMAFRDERWD